MKIGVVGCGALGAFYGAKLARAGREVHLLLRSDYEVVRADGIVIQSAEGDFRVRPHYARVPEEIGKCDLVLIGLKTTANDQFARLVTPLVGDSTAVLTLQNGLGNEAQLADLFGPEKIMGGLCFVCLNRIAPGVVQQIGAGKIVLGEFLRSSESRAEMIASMFRHAGVPCTVTGNLEKAHWEKLVWNIPFNGLGVAGIVGFEAVIEGAVPDRFESGCLDTEALLADSRWESLVRELMHEVIAIGNQLGLAMNPKIAEMEIERTRKIGSYKASTLIDFECSRPLELNALFLEPLRQARKAKVPTPRLEALCRILEKLDENRREN